MCQNPSPDILHGSELGSTDYPEVGNPARSRPASATCQQFVNKTSLFWTVFWVIGIGKATEPKVFRCWTSKLTRWSSAVRARTGLPLISFNLERDVRSIFPESPILVTMAHQSRKLLSP